MKYLIVVGLFFVSGCSAIRNEVDHGAQRREARQDESYVPWEAAASLVKGNCEEVASVYQGHSRVVGVSFIDGSSITTISPEIDQILDVIHECRGSYDGIPILME